MYQKLTILGNLGRDPEMRFTPGGTPVCNFNVAASRSYKNNQGERVKETTWFRVTTWNKQAEVCNQYLKKGSKVLIEGRLNHDENGNPVVFTRQDGSAGASFEVTAENITFVESGNGNGSSEALPEPEQSEEIPF